MNDNYHGDMFIVAMVVVVSYAHALQWLSTTIAHMM